MVGADRILIWLGNLQHSSVSINIAFPSNYYCLSYCKKQLFLDHELEIIIRNFVQNNFYHNCVSNLLSKYSSMQDKKPQLIEESPTIIFFRGRKMGGRSIEKHLDKLGLSARYKTHDVFPDTRIITIPAIAAEDTANFRKKIARLNQIENSVSFAVIRNPYDKVKSSYLYLKHRPNQKNKSTIDMFREQSLEHCLRNKPSFSEETAHDYRHFSATQTEWTHFDGKLLPDFLLKFENLNNELHSFFLKFGYDLPEFLRVNKGPRVKFELSNTEIGLINDIFHEDFVNFGYKKLRCE